MDYANRTRLLGKPQRLSENAKTALAVIALFVIYAFVGTMEYNDAVSYQAEVSKVCR